MNIQKLLVEKPKLDINLQFYFFLKHIVKLKPTENQILNIIETIDLLKNSNKNTIIDSIKNIFRSKKDNKFNKKYETLEAIILRFYDLSDIFLFSFSLKLYQIKDLLLQEAKITKSSDLTRLSKIDPLSLEYDTISVMKPYTTRVSGALLSLLFFEKIHKNETNFMADNTYKFIHYLSKEANEFRKLGLEANQIFMLMFSETINQSIISDSGSNYENRILSVLNKIGIKGITKEHDKNDKSTEFDFFFTVDNKTYGIGAKRTLRERYKQFIKTALTSKIDIMIEITLGIDLNYEKAKTIINHGTYIFIADEVYKTRDYFHTMDMVYSTKDLNLKTLRSLK